MAQTTLKKQRDRPSEAALLAGISNHQLRQSLSLAVTVEKCIAEVALPTSSSLARIHGQLEVGLHQGGRRLTPQRRRVLDLFESIGSGIHLSAEEVHQQLLEANSKVSLATIYRTLRLLVEMGFLHELEISDGGHRFELASHDHPDHHHLVCVRCGRTEEFESKPVLEAGRSAAERIGFQLIESTLNVRALCPSCQRPSTTNVH